VKRAVPRTNRVNFLRRAQIEREFEKSEEKARDIGQSMHGRRNDFQGYLRWVDRQNSGDAGEKRGKNTVGTISGCYDKNEGGDKEKKKGRKRE